MMLDNRELRRELRSLDAKLSRTTKELMERIDELTVKVFVRNIPKKVKSIRRIGFKP